MKQTENRNGIENLDLLAIVGIDSAAGAGRMGKP